MAKFLFFLAVIVAIYLVVRASNRRRKPPEQAAESSGIQAMAQCAYCRVHFPQVEALDRNGKEFCCEEHRRLGAGD